MNINLKEKEITAALEQYISSQGISLVGKTVQMAFTAGRKAAGLSVDIVIEDGGVVEAAAETAVVAVVAAVPAVKTKTADVVKLEPVAKETPKQEPAPEPDAEGENRPLGQLPANDPEASPAKSVSLFG